LLGRLGGVEGYERFPWGWAIVGVFIIENRDVFADKNDPIPAPQDDRGLSGPVMFARPAVGLVFGESEGNELVLVRENGRRWDAFGLEL